MLEQKLQIVSWDQDADQDLCSFLKIEQQPALLSAETVRIEKFHQINFSLPSSVMKSRQAAVPS